MICLAEPPSSKKEISSKPIQPHKRAVVGTQYLDNDRLGGRTALKGTTIAIVLLRQAKEEKNQERQGRIDSGVAGVQADW